jgi:hypothetical protein
VGRALSARLNRGRPGTAAPPEYGRHRNFSGKNPDEMWSRRPRRQKNRRGRRFHIKTFPGRTGFFLFFTENRKLPIENRIRPGAFPSSIPAPGAGGPVLFWPGKVRSPGAPLRGQAGAQGGQAPLQFLHLFGQPVEFLGQIADGHGRAFLQRAFHDMTATTGPIG